MSKLGFRSSSAQFKSKAALKDVGDALHHIPEVVSGLSSNVEHAIMPPYTKHLFNGVTHMGRDVVLHSLPRKV
jgi:hypothetical protein